MTIGHWNIFALAISVDRVFLVGERAERLGPTIDPHTRALRRLSASSVAKFDPSQDGGCPTRWWFDKVGGIDEPERKFQAGGKELHAQNEHYLLTGEDVLGALARQGKHFIPAPGPDLLVEFPLAGERDTVSVASEARDVDRALWSLRDGTGRHEHVLSTVQHLDRGYGASLRAVQAHLGGAAVARDVTSVFRALERARALTTRDPHERVVDAYDAARRNGVFDVDAIPVGTLVSRRGVPWVGFVDLAHRRDHWLDADGQRQPLGPREIEVVDWKTTKAIAAWAKRGMALVRTVQMPAYAEWALRRWPDLEAVRVSQGYFATERHRDAALADKTTYLMRREDVAVRWAAIEATVDAAADVAREVAPEKVEKNYAACGAYGGCPYRDRCPRDPARVLEEILGSRATLVAPGVREVEWRAAVEASEAWVVRLAAAEMVGDEEDDMTMSGPSAVDEAVAKCETCGQAYAGLASAGQDGTLWHMVSPPHVASAVREPGFSACGWDPSPLHVARAVSPRDAFAPPFESFALNGLLCNLCGQAQRTTPSGDVCVNGHGDAPGVRPAERGADGNLGPFGSTRSAVAWSHAFTVLRSRKTGDGVVVRAPAAGTTAWHFRNVVPRPEGGLTLSAEVDTQPTQWFADEWEDLSAIPAHAGVVAELRRLYEGLVAPSGGAAVLPPDAPKSALPGAAAVVPPGTALSPALERVAAEHRALVEAGSAATVAGNGAPPGIAPVTPAGLAMDAKLAGGRTVQEYLNAVGSVDATGQNAKPDDVGSVLNVSGSTAKKALEVMVTHGLLLVRAQRPYAVSLADARQLALPIAAPAAAASVVASLPTIDAPPDHAPINNAGSAHIGRAAEWRPLTLFLDVRVDFAPGAVTDLEPYVQQVHGRLCAAARLHDVRLASGEHDLAYGRWKAAVQAAVRQDPPSGLCFLRVGDDDLKREFATALIAIASPSMGGGGVVTR